MLTAWSYGNRKEEMSKVGNYFIRLQRKDDCEIEILELSKDQTIFHTL